ncbi:mismatch-specific DNA-glycosylase [Microbacterium proteolyticum]|uniref:mismatch-specific DNA-glycosylase n=1 Tax=Microbacterium proteolyticum TaxID=1572644 RepID=UPI001FABD727|nr:mismatch-specific DNA-glycosylase [Microbacterium proteolyticum]MCI9857269.1 mismatch-specific DNA-glycosylase [Microbacterium proteolyticum]
MGFTRAELESFRDATIPDLVEPGVRLLFVGINPGLWTAATGTPFARPGNRFWPALVEARVLPRLPRYAEELGEDDRRMIFDAGVGVSNLVARATARADELSRDELRTGAAALVDRVAAWRPRVVAVVGLTAYRQGFRRPRAVAGRQEESIADVPTWVLPNPSGLNAHDTVATLARAYAEPARAAGVPV